MVFGFNNKKDSLRTLSEDDIRNKLYGSAVGAESGIRSQEQKKASKHAYQQASPIVQETNNEQFKIRADLASLRKELEQTKRKLNRMRGVKAKKIRLLIISLVAIVIAVAITTAIIKRIGKARPSQTLSTTQGLSGYTIQVATSDSSDDARRFASRLVKKGYKTFIHKGKFASGKDKFVIYVGRFNTADSASPTLKSLKSKESIGDSFVTRIPE